ncbi:type I pullulanase [Francisella sp. Scap27]|uniref:type I pullulanase n=1 Tax=Francisella sp. Scap27 TaxID=2589986 RepID=UPI0015BF59CE|nr:type I pullulanase [Francisella sp. Scap27]QLE78408.1 type I pullulanase [Francisella sp. Scap27]
MDSKNKKIWLIDKDGNPSISHFKYQIHLDYETNTVQFRIQATGFINGFVVGDFNNWYKSKEFELSWVADTTDGSLWLTATTYNVKNLKETNDFSFTLIDLHGDEFRVSSCEKPFAPLSFKWVSHKKEMQIKASENTISKGYPLEIIAIKESVSGIQEIVDVDWQISPKLDGIKLLDNKLTISPEVDITKVEISCISKNDKNIKATRDFVVNNEKRKGSLVHFIKKDRQYNGDNFCWDLWTYNEGKKAKPVELSHINDFGVYNTTNKSNLIARKKTWSDHWQDDWSEQTIAFDISSKADNYYIIHGDENIYTSLREAINRLNPTITYAVMDEPNKIAAYLSEKVRVGTIFELWINSKNIKDVCIVAKQNTKQLIFTNLPPDIKGSDLIEIRANNTFLPTKVVMGNYLDKFYYPDNDMGVVFNDENVSIRLWAPTAIKVDLLLFDEDNPNNSIDFNHIYQLKNEEGYGTFFINLTREQCENKYYLFKLYFDELDANGDKYTKTTYARDPYAYGLSINGQKGFILDIDNLELKPTDWDNQNFTEISNPQDAIIYEAHIRDFTISDDSGVEKLYKGKFLGAVQGNTKYIEQDQSVSTGIDSIVELGITHIHLLPIFDFSSVDETKLHKKNNRNWGYDPENYNAPDGSYSINPFDPSQRILGVRTMVQEFHNKNIGVVMDMVYNHMTDTTNLDKIVPKYYFRTDLYGRFTNGSGCGNEVASERPMVSKFIQDSVLHWVKNYKIDGLRFDLMELIDLDTIKNIVEKAKKINPSALIYGEPWKAADSPLMNCTYKGTQRNNDFAIFNDTFRDAVRGNNAPGNGFINGSTHNSELMGKVVEGLYGSVHTLTANANESVNYVDAHDNYTLWDQIEKSQNHSLKTGDYRKNLPENIFDNHIVRQNALAMSIILTAQGIPFIHGGAEFLRTKHGDHNSYKSGDDINAYHWSDKLHNKVFFDFIKGLITIRRNHPALRMSSPEMIKNHLTITPAYNDYNSGVIIAHFKDYANGDSWKDIVIVYNATAIDNYDINAQLPTNDNDIWHIVANHEKAGEETIKQAKIGEIPMLKSHSIMILRD